MATETQADAPVFTCTGHIQVQVSLARDPFEAARIFLHATGSLPEMVSRDGAEFWVGPKRCACLNVHFAERPPETPGERRSPGMPVVDCGGCETAPNSTADRLRALVSLSKRIEALVGQLPASMEPVGAATLELFNRTCYSLANAFILAGTSNNLRPDAAGRAMLGSRVKAWNDNVPKGSTVVLVGADGKTTRTATTSTAWVNDNGIPLVVTEGGTPARLDNVVPCLGQSIEVAS